jgi:Reverse transcriptase (RNA-dependent DNA polymerase)
LFDGFKFVQTYIDDLLTLTKGTFKDHLEKLERVLYRLRQAGLKINGNKSFFAKTELEYLGYWITRDGIKPLPDKVKAILAIDTPKNRKELRSFIGNKKKWDWGPQQDVAFNMAKKFIRMRATIN